MIINFRARVISRDARKMTQTPTLIIIKNNKYRARAQSCLDNWFLTRKKRVLSEMEGRTASIFFYILPIHLNAFHHFLLDCIVVTCL